MHNSGSGDQRGSAFLDAKSGLAFTVRFFGALGASRSRFVDFTMLPVSSECSSNRLLNILHPILALILDVYLTSDCICRQ